MTRPAWRIAELLPHGDEAILLDDVLACGDDSLSASVTIRPDCPFYQEHGVPAHVGLEYMAQACGAFVGIEALLAGRAPRAGLLLGTRRYLAERAWFTDGERLSVSITLVYRDDELGVFDCNIESNGTIIAQAQLTVAQPTDVETLLAGGTSSAIGQGTE